jgi:hypothetical protein
LRAPSRQRREPPRRLTGKGLSELTSVYFDEAELAVVTGGADIGAQAVVEAIEASHPELVRDAKEWRRALSQLQREKGWSLAELRAGLERAGVRREMLTIEGWLRLERAAPIGPRHVNKELAAIWNLINAHAETTVDQAASACSQLRSLRSTAGSALIKQWKGISVDLGVDRTWLAELVRQLRQQVDVHEVESLSYGVVPLMMLGWWISPEMATAFERASDSSMPKPT